MDVFCSDKTGTLHPQQMTVVSRWCWTATTRRRARSFCGAGIATREPGLIETTDLQLPEERLPGTELTAWRFSISSPSTRSASAPERCCSKRDGRRSPRSRARPQSAHRHGRPRRSESAERSRRHRSSCSPRGAIATLAVGLPRATQRWSWSA